MKLEPFKKFKKRVFRVNMALVICAFTLSFFPGCERIKGAYNKLTQKEGPPAPPESPIFAVNTTSVVQGQIQDYIALSGDIIAGSTVDAYSDAVGKVSRLYVSVGSRVRKGQAIAEVDPSKPGMTYVPGVATAPVGGTVVSLPAQVGMTVSQAVPLARIAAGGALEIRLYVAERFISKIRQGLSCEITLDAWPGDVFRGSISEVSPTVDPASRTMEIKINVENPGSKLKAGMFAKVKVITERKDHIVKIPSSALVNRFGEQYVFVVGEGLAEPSDVVARKRNITPGILIDGVLEVQQGLAPDEEIIVRGQSLLEDGARINVIERTATLGAQ